MVLKLSTLSRGGAAKAHAHASEQPPESCISVVVRVRPHNEKENANKSVLRIMDEKVICFDPQDRNVLPIRGVPSHSTRARDNRYAFDRVFDQYATQENVFEHTTKPLIQGVLDGYNATVFAYGATGAGKTHTMVGNDTCPGVMVLTMRALFEAMKATSDERTYRCTVSYLEVYNEMIIDLLCDDDGARKPLLLCEDAKRGMVVQGLTGLHPKTADEVFELLERGNLNRSVSATNANAHSSRSHAVLQIQIEQKDRTANVRSNVRIAKLSLIDLAGSERAAATQNRGARMREGARINQSLLALGNCINALAAQGNSKRPSHVPYRDSKLTRLLKDSLGGNCRTVMIANCSPSWDSYEDSHNTLKYAARAKSIKVRITKNVVSVEAHITEYKRIVADLRGQVAQLKLSLKREREKSPAEASASASASASDTDTKHKSGYDDLVAKLESNIESRVVVLRSIHKAEDLLHDVMIGLDAARAEQKTQMVNSFTSRQEMLSGRLQDLKKEKEELERFYEKEIMDPGLRVKSNWSEIYKDAFTFRCKARVGDLEKIALVQESRVKDRNMVEQANRVMLGDTAAVEHVSTVRTPEKGKTRTSIGRYFGLAGGAVSPTPSPSLNAPGRVERKEAPSSVRSSARRVIKHKAYDLGGAKRIEFGGDDDQEVQKENGAAGTLNTNGPGSGAFRTMQPKSYFTTGSKKPLNGIRRLGDKSIR